MPKYPFLSDSWIEETRRLRDEFRSRISPPAMPPLRANLIVEKAPFAEQPVHAHLDTSSGEPEIEIGHLANADARITVDYATAKAVFVEGNLAAAMEGMQLGRVRVEGDAMKLMSLAGLSADPASIELGRAIRDITE